jgi:hypothetical protein
MESQTIDLREVDSPFKGEKWIQNIIIKQETITCNNEDHYKGPSGIPNHNCVKERVSSCNYSHTPEPTFTHSGIVTQLPSQYCPLSNK